MDVGAAFPSDPQASEAVQPGECALDDPAVGAESAAVLGASPGDEGLHAAVTQFATMRLGIVAAVGVERARPSPGSARRPAHRGHGVNEADELRDVVTVRRRQARGQGDAAAVDEEVMLAARTRAICWIRPRLFPPLLPPG